MSYIDCQTAVDEVAWPAQAQVVHWHPTRPLVTNLTTPATI